MLKSLLRVLGVRQKGATKPNRINNHGRGKQTGRKLGKQASAKCPYCRIVVTPAPVRTRKCPKCREKIVVRTKNKRKVYLRAEELEAFDRARAVESLHRAAIQAADRIEIDRNAFLERERELAKSMPGAGPQDVFWTLANERAMNLMKGGLDAGAWRKLSNVYFQQALWLSNRGKPYWNLKEQSEMALANHYRMRGIRQLELMASDCPGCKKYNGRTYAAKRAQKEWPIREGDCTAEWCNCTWNMVVDV